MKVNISKELEERERERKRLELILSEYRYFFLTIIFIFKKSAYRRFSTDFKELNEIMELAMNITADSHWCFDSCYIILLG